MLEPTCGLGSFLEAASILAPGSERVGLEIDPSYAATAGAFGRVAVADVFRTSLAADVTWETDGPLHVVGNPPWITSAQLTRLGATNVPPKTNARGARGIDAMLGSSNFDVAEFVILKALTEIGALAVEGRRVRLGMLCKTQVARNVLVHAAREGLPVTRSSLHRIDAMRWFGAGVDAGWFTVDLDPAAATRPTYVTDVHASLDDDADAADADVSVRFGVVDGRLVSDVDRYEPVRAADGTSPWEWRSGLKHDAASVFEISGERPDLEHEHVLPLVKSTALFRGRHRDGGRWVVVPQRTFGEDTTGLEQTAPRLWAYLTSHAATLDARRSSIYRNRPRFTVFGHGDYTWAPFKVAVSGLHRNPVFRLLAPLDGQPVVLDDTCYFVPFDDPADAAVATALLRSDAARDLLDSLVFPDSKRPVTKRLLARVDVRRLPVDRGAVLADALAVAAEAGVEVDEAAARLALERVLVR